MDLSGHDVDFVPSQGNKRSCDECICLWNIVHSRIGTGRDPRQCYNANESSKVVRRLVRMKFAKNIIASHCLSCGFCCCCSGSCGNNLYESVCYVWLSMGTINVCIGGNVRSRKYSRDSYYHLQQRWNSPVQVSTFLSSAICPGLCPRSGCIC